VALPSRPVAVAAVATAIPANVDPGVPSATGSNDGHVTVAGMRIVGPDYSPSGSAAGGEPPKLAKPDTPDLPLVATAEPPLHASIVPNLLDFLRNRVSTPPEPDAEPAD
jgi:hypothetical protein